MPSFSTNPLLTGNWQVSDWNAGQSNVLRWSPNNVLWNDAADTLDFVLDKAPKGSRRPYVSGEIQSVDSASTGTWSWTAQAPELVSGSIFGLFTYKADHFNDPWIEFDFEFLGKDAGDFDRDGDIDVTSVRLNIHMESPTGGHITLEEEIGTVIVPLGFDATEGMHTYEVTVTDTDATFRIDGAQVGVFDALDMPGDYWTTGAMKCFVNLWCVDTSPAMEAWAGKWVYPGKPLVGKVAAVSRPSGGTTEPDPEPTVDKLGSAFSDRLRDDPGVSTVFRGAGGEDYFYFVDGPRGKALEKDVILDFNPIVDSGDHDTIVISKALAGVKGFSGLYRNITDVGGEAVLKFADGSTLTFDNLRKADLSYDDFAFVA